MNHTTDQIIAADEEARGSLGQTALMAGLLALTTVMAAVGLDGVPPAVLWALAGFLAAEVWYSATAARAARRVAADLRACPACRAHVARADAADAAWSRCARTDHHPEDGTR